MVRPKRCRLIYSQPNVTYFKPRGIPMINLEEVVISLDEYEAIRLKDLENLDQESSAVKMGISQPTFYRLISSAHKKIADALINGKAMKIEGGHIEICKNGEINQETQGLGYCCRNNQEFKIEQDTDLNDNQDIDPNNKKKKTTKGNN